MEIEAERLHHEIVILKTAIEEAIIKGQKSMGDLDDILGSGLVLDEDFALIFENAGLGIVGWVDNF